MHAGIENIASPEAPKRRGRRALSDDEKAAALRRALEQFPLLPDEALVREDVVTALLGFSRATLWNRVRAERMPAPRRIGPGHVRWRVGDIRKVMAGAA